MGGLVNRGEGTAIGPGGTMRNIEPVYTEPNTVPRLGTQYRIPAAPTTWKAPVVTRAQDTRGMRYLWARVYQRMPISPLGTGPDLGQSVWSSEFQPVQGSLRDYGFYDLLFRSGYPGFNLGLSFRVPVNPSVGSNSPGANIYMKAPPQRLRISVLRRSTGTPNTRG